MPDPWEVGADDAKQKAIQAPPSEPANAIPMNPWDVQQEQPQSPPVSAGDVASEIGTQVPIGAYKGVTGIFGLPGDLAQAAENRLGPEKAAMMPTLPFKVLPTSQDLERWFEPITGPIPNAQHWYGEYARTLGEMIPNAAGGEAGIMTRIARVMAPALVGETARQGMKAIGASEDAQGWAKMAGAMTPATLAAMWRTAPERAEEIRDKLLAQARRAYSDPAITGLRVKTPVVQGEAFNIANDLYQAGMRDFPGSESAAVAHAVNELAFGPPSAASAGKPSKIPAASKGYIDYRDIDAVRNRLSILAEDYNNPTQQRLAIMAKRKIDDWMANLGQSDLVAGDAKAATGKLAEARSDYWAGMSLKYLGDKIFQGQTRGGIAYSGQNMENAIRARIGDIVIEEKKHPSGQYTKKELELMEKAAVPRGTEQLARRVARMIPRHGAMGTLTGLAVGHVTGSPELTLLGAGVGEMAASLESRLARRALRDVQKEIANRAHTQFKLPTPRHDITAAGVLARPREESRQDENTFRFDDQGRPIPQ